LRKCRYTITRSRMKQFWSETRWILLGIIWLAGLSLGYAGFAQFTREHALGWSMGDIFYRTLQLIILESGSVDGRVNWSLETARFLLPALTVYTALKALMHLFQEQTQMLRLWWLRDHAIICGVGRKGSRLASELLRNGKRVVIIERDNENTAASELQRKGAILLKGDATDRFILASARIHRSRHMICLLGEDSQNLEIAFQAYQLSQERLKGVLTCFVHLASSDMLNLVKRSELSLQSDVPILIETFHPYARAAQLLVQEDPAWVDPSILPGHLLVIGLGRLGEQLVNQACYTWYRSNKSKRLVITILDRDAKEKTDLLLHKYPRLENTCQLNPLQVDVSSTCLLTSALKIDSALQPIQLVYICLGNPILSLQVCLCLLNLPEHQTVPIRVRMEEKSGLHGLLEKQINEEPFGGQVISFDIYRRTCSAQLVTGGSHELLARELHELYRREIERSSHEQPYSPTWDHLPEDVKEVNRQQASRIHHLLNSAGYRINPLQNWDADKYNFMPEEVEQMARLEHDLWRKVKEKNGWRYGLKKDKIKKCHPDLIPWEKLPDLEKQKNVAFICHLPSLLARLGFQVDRVVDAKRVTKIPGRETSP
jgi:hypothetical protein